MTETAAKDLFAEQLAIYRRDHAVDLDAIKPAKVTDAQLDTLVIEKAMEFWKELLQPKPITSEQAAQIISGVVVKFLSIKGTEDAKPDPHAPKDLVAFDKLYQEPLKEAIRLALRSAQIDETIGLLGTYKPVLDTLWKFYQGTGTHPTTAEVYGVISNAIAPYSLRTDSAVKIGEVSDALVAPVEASKLAANTATTKQADATPPGQPAAEPDKDKPWIKVIIMLAVAAVGLLALSYYMKLNRR